MAEGNTIRNLSLRMCCDLTQDDRDDSQTESVNNIVVTEMDDLAGPLSIIVNMHYLQVYQHTHINCGETECTMACGQCQVGERSEQARGSIHRRLRIRLGPVVAGQ